MEYLLLEKQGSNYKLIDKGDLPKLYRQWLANPTERYIVKIVEVEMVEKLS